MIAIGPQLGDCLMGLFFLLACFFLAALGALPGVAFIECEHYRDVYAPHYTPITRAVP